MCKIIRITGIVVVAIIVAFVVLRVFVLGWFKIPTSSMYPALQPGDNIIVSKIHTGAKLYNVFAALRGEDVKIYHIAGIKKPKRNDILVFYYPYPLSNNTISLHPNTYHIKRCMGLPGDSLEIVNGHYYINGAKIDSKNNEVQHNVSPLPNNEITQSEPEVYPRNAAIKWDCKNFGPLFIPAKGSTINMDSTTFVPYKHLIDWEQQKPLRLLQNTVYLDNLPIKTYTFKSNYYFMAGDNASSSYDSRHWGLLPEEFIVGKAWFIWKSEDMQTGKINRSRFLKKIH